jgi:hypothetical protein
MYIINNFSTWKRNLNEGLFWDVTEREPVGGTVHKVKVKYLDGNSFKVKAVNDRDMVGAGGTIEPSLMDAIINFLKTHDGTDFAREYPALQDLAAFYKDSFFTFNVKKENDRRQVLVFTIQKRSNFKGVTPETKVISDDQAATMTQAPAVKNLLAQSDKALSQNTTEQPVAAGSFKLDRPLAIADLVNQTASSSFFKLFDSAVASMATSNLFDDKRAKELINKVADELEAQKIGENSIKLIKGLMAGFGATTFVDKYGRTKEQSQITQPIIDKLAALVPKATAQNSSRQYPLGRRARTIFEQTADAAAVKVTLPADFKMEEFIKAISAGEMTTGDIKLPEEGLVKGKIAKGDAELIKFQQLVINTFKNKKLAKFPLYKKFASYAGDGNYGPTTEKMVAALKKALGCSETSGTTITAELISKLLTNKIEESYLGLNYQLVEQFDYDAFGEVEKSYTASSKGSGTAKKKEEPKKAVNLETIDAKFIEYANQIKSYIENSDNFSAFKGADDDEEEAWEANVLKQFSKIADSIKTNLVPMVKGVEKSNPEDYKDYMKSLNIFGHVLKGQNGYYQGTPTQDSKWIFKDTFLGSSDTGDTYNLMLYLSTGAKKIEIDTDF